MQLNFHRQGQDPSQFPTIVLIHGLLGSWQNLNTVAKSLAANFAVLSVDLPNHGHSPHGEIYSCRQMAEILLTNLNQLGGKTFSLLGHSLGGKVAMQLAIDQPSRVDKLIVSDIAPASYEARHNHVFAGLAAVDLNLIDSRQAADKALQGAIEVPGIRQFLLKSLDHHEGRFFWRFNWQGLRDSYGTLAQGIEGDGRYGGPTLFVKGGNSDYITEAHRNAILKYFPNSKARIIQDAGHWIHAEKPDAFNRVINQFLLA